MNGTDLEARLARLADGEVDNASPLPEALWTRGRAWQRRRRIAGALSVVTTVVLAAGLVGSLLPLVAPEASRPTPASTEDGVRVPDRLYGVSPWLGAVQEGPLVAVQYTLRGTWRGVTGAGLVGVSAVTGEYGFLDLPDLADPEVALSPEGGHLAYWFSGEPEGDPNTSNTDGDLPAVGLAVRDLRTGEERRHRVSTDHGIRGQGLVWMDETTVVLGYMQYAVGDSGPEDERGSSYGMTPWWWKVDEGDPVEWPWADEYPTNGFWSARDGRVARIGDSLALLDHAAGKRVRVRPAIEGTPSIGNLSTLSLGPEGRLAVLGAEGATASPAQVRVGRLTASGDALVDLDVLPGVDNVFGFAGWRRGDVLAYTSVSGEGGDGDVAIVALDPVTGEGEPVISGDLESDFMGWHLAQGLLETADVVEGRTPPDPVDPRLAAAAWAVGLVAVLGGFLVWRRRGRP